MRTAAAAAPTPGLMAHIPGQLVRQPSLLRQVDLHPCVRQEGGGPPVFVTAPCHLCAAA